MGVIRGVRGGLWGVMGVNGGKTCGPIRINEGVVSTIEKIGLVVQATHTKFGSYGPVETTDIEPNMWTNQNKGIEQYP